MQSTQHFVCPRAPVPPTCRATYTAPAHNTQHTTICSLRASVPSAFHTTATQTACITICSPSCLCACVSHSTSTQLTQFSSLSCPRASCVPHSTGAQHSAHSNLLALVPHIAAMQSTQHLVRSRAPCLLRATHTAPAHDTQHTTICSLRASVPPACQKQQRKAHYNLLALVPLCPRAT